MTMKPEPECLSLKFRSLVLCFVGEAVPLARTVISTSPLRDGDLLTLPSIVAPTR